MAMAGEIGANIEQPKADSIASFFGEDQGRYIITVKQSEYGKVKKQAELANIPCIRIGATGGKDLKLGEANAISVLELKNAHQEWFPEYMKEEL